MRALAALCGVLALGFAACGNGGNAKNEKVAVAAAALTTSVTITASKAGNINHSKTVACLDTYAVVNNNSQVGGGSSIAGCAANDVHRDYFYFNLSGVSHASATTPSSAAFSTSGRNNNGTLNSITFRKYSGDPTSGDLQSNFNAMPSGSSYGSVAMTGGNNPDPVPLNLGGTALSDIQSILGSGAFSVVGVYGSELANVYAISVAPTSTLTLGLTCDANYADCNAGTDGCEKAINTDAACGTTCATSACTTSQTCSSGACTACGAGTMDCDANAVNACEKSSTDTSCGCASTACTINQTCSSGSCAACAAGTRDCDTNYANGCEKATNTDASCGTTCSTSACTTSQTCSGNACAACPATKQDCDASAANGCEKTNTDASCGCSATACTTSQTCNTSTGSCGACAAGTLDCDSSAANGCEKTNTDASCGCSSTVCTTSQSCNTTTGACGACTAGTLDCDGSAANGCEKTNSNASCGCSNTVCSSSQSCNTTTGVCSACPAGTLDCDGNAANGCENVINLATSCGTTCANTVSCDDSNVCTVDSCSAGACTHPAGNAGTVCRPSAGVCDVAESCTGSSTSCPTDGFLPSTTLCRTQSDVCDASEYCSGSASTCTSDAYAAAGTDCGYTTGGLVIYASGLPASSSDTSSHWSSETLTNAGPTSTWTDALKFVATASAGSHARYDYWKISTASHTFLDTEYIEYDVYLADNQTDIGGIDVATSSGYLSSSVGPATDQNNLSSDPATDISALAYGRWYHRRFALSGLGIVGKSSTKWDVVDENDTASATYTAYYDNIIVAVKPGACDGADVCKVKDGGACSLASECVSNSCLASECGLPRATGVACKSDTQCISGFCTDSVCCTTACAGGTTDCQACSTAAGAASNGTCSIASATTVCRASVASCDVAELCNGTDTTCPLDTQ